jgi:hypothetical protein
MVATLAVIACLYLMFLYIAVHAMVTIWSNPARTAIGATQDLPEADFARSWFVGKLLDMQRLAALGVHIPPSPWSIAAHKMNLLARDATLYNDWLYPPTMNLLAMAAAFMPLPTGYWLWSIGTPPLAAWLVRRAGLDWTSIALGLAGTASVQNFELGQNGALTGGLLVAALLWSAKRPVLGGALAGLLCIKPQIAVFMPAVFLNGRGWRGIGGMMLSSLALILLSVIVEGWQIWAWYFSVGEPASMLVLKTPFARNYPIDGVTVFFMARSFHAGLRTAFALQMLCAGIAVFLIWRLWQRPGRDAVPLMAVTVCLAAFVSPYGYFFDLVGYSLGMAAMFMRAPDSRRPIYALCWLAPGYSGLIGAMTGHIFMPVAAALGAFMAWRELDA